MFTGIITDLGEVVEIEEKGDWRIRIKTSYDLETVDLGASIACNGVCLTVTHKGDDWFDVDVSGETLSKTSIGDWKAGRRINLERALKVGDELGGHIVSGHVDGLATIRSITPEGDSKRFSFELDPALTPFVAPKGSVTIEGTSLTVNEVDDSGFGVNIIPFTQEKTIFQYCQPGDRVNIEIDVLARYVSRIMERGNNEK